MARILTLLITLVCLSGCSTMNPDGTRRPGLLANLGHAMQQTSQPIINSKSQHCVATNTGVSNGFGDTYNVDCE